MAVLLLYTCTAVVRSINTVTPHGDNPSVSRQNSVLFITGLVRKEKRQIPGQIVI